MPHRSALLNLQMWTGFGFYEESSMHLCFDSAVFTDTDTTPPPTPTPHPKYVCVGLLYLNIKQTASRNCT